MFVSKEKYKRLEEELQRSEDARRKIADDWYRTASRNSELGVKVKFVEAENERLKARIKEAEAEIAELKEKYTAAVHKNFELSEILAGK